MSVFVLILPNSVGIRGVIHRRVNSMPVGIDFDLGPLQVLLRKGVGISTYNRYSR